MNSIAAQFRRRRRGFTFLEMTVAMAIAATLAGALWKSMQYYHIATGVEAALEPPRVAALAMDFMRNDLQCAAVPDGVFAGDFEGTQAYDDRGHEGDDLVFFSTADSAQHLSANGEIKQIELTVVTDPATGDHLLVRRVTRNLLAQPVENPDQETICRGVWAFTLQYSTGSEWQTTWDSTQMDNTAPAAVQVNLDLERPDPRGGVPIITHYVRTFVLSCSTAAQDPTVNTGTSINTGMSLP